MGSSGANGLSHVMLLNSDSSTELDLKLVGIC